MANYTKVSKEQGARIELHEKLGLTGAEISINTLPAGEHVPFVHAHKQNEEIYYIEKGNGKVIVFCVFLKYGLLIFNTARSTFLLIVTG